MLAVVCRFQSVPFWVNSVMKTRLHISSAQHDVGRVQGKGGSPSDPARSMPPAESSSVDLPQPCKKALVLWLQWNDAYEQSIAKMFHCSQDQRALEDMMDRMDRLRRDAVELSQDLLD